MFQHYVLGLVEGVVKDLGWDVAANDSVVRAQHRADMLATACHLEHPDCFEHSVRMYTNWMFTPNPDMFNE